MSTKQAPARPGKKTWIDYLRAHIAHAIEDGRYDSANALAIKAGISQATMHKLLAGKRDDLRLSSAEAIARELGIDLFRELSAAA